MADFLCFLLRCISGGFDFAITEFAYLDGVCVAIGLLLVCRRNKSHRRAWEQFLEGIVRKFAGILILGQLVLSVFLIAPYVQFHDEQEKNKKTTSENAKLQKQLDDKSAKLGGFVDQQIIADEPGTTNSLIFLQVSISNSGLTPSIADYYKLNVILTNNESVLAKPIDFTDSYSWNTLRSNTLTIYKLKRSELISEKTGTPIQPGAEPRGWLERFK
jgi:hypothetical protein